MLQITIPAREFWDEESEVFVNVKAQTLCLEHSLISLSKWESKWHKPFMTKAHKSREETIDYIRCMTLTQNVDPAVYESLSSANLKTIYTYIDDPMTASTLPKSAEQGKQETITSELIYYWMVALQIPFECQKWHLNRLLMLIQVCNFKNSPPKKMGQKALLSRYSAMNANRWKQHKKRR